VGKVGSVGRDVVMIGVGRNMASKRYSNVNLGKNHTQATLGHLEGICRSSRWLGQGLGEVAVGAVRALHRPAGAAGPAPAIRREGRLVLRMTPVPAGRCGEGRGRKDARSAVLRDAHVASVVTRQCGIWLKTRADTRGWQSHQLVQRECSA